MKLLWITNILFPEAQLSLTHQGDLKASGGWMIGASNSIMSFDNIKLTIATVSPLVRELKRVIGEKILYYIIPICGGNKHPNSKYEPYWKKIYNEVSPDIVHIFGTEFSHGLAYMNACGSNNVVISIQGLTSSCSYYYHYGMSKSDIYHNLTLRDIIKGSIIRGQKQFNRRAKYEIDMLRMAQYVIGRTSWDKSHIWAINPKLQYFFCNEILRDEFYKGDRWNYDRCLKHSIFVSQAGYPLKGLHQLIKAMPLIIRHYPDTVIRIAGADISKTATLKDKLYLSGYGKYLNKLIAKFNLKNKVTFTGSLNAEEMKQEYLRANVFVCPSSIENSPNSLGEAQILGTPCIASYVGGAMDMMDGNEENLYRFEEIEMLANKVCNIFKSAEKQTDMRLTAAKRHNPQINGRQLYDIYQTIMVNNLNQ